MIESEKELLIFEKETPTFLNEKYNTQKGLFTVCKTLPGTHELLAARLYMQKSINKKLKGWEGIILKDFLVALTWVFNEFGVYRLQKEYDIQKELAEIDLGFVLPTEQLLAYLSSKKSFFDQFYDHIMKEQMNYLPPLTETCLVCKEGWGNEHIYLNDLTRRVENDGELHYFHSNCFLQHIKNER